jgi:sugar/nucleoside kinase (ribokinase family)
LMETLSHDGVDTSGVRLVSEQTTLALVARNSGGIPDFVFYRGADAALRPEDIPQNGLSRSSFVHVSSMALMSEPSRSATMHAVEIGREEGALISVDPNLRPSSWSSLEVAIRAIKPLLQSADVLKLNDTEALFLTGRRELSDALQDLSDEHRLTIVTKGQEGCIWNWQGRAGEVPSPSVVVVDTTGAGDAFVGGCLAELCRAGYVGEGFRALGDEAIAAILRFACATGAYTCQGRGVMSSLPTRSQVVDLLQTAVSTPGIATS